MKNKSLLFIITLLALMSFTKGHELTIFMIGDSTMANKNLENSNQERGWGQLLPAFLNENIRVDNHAQNGRSSKSFIDEGRWNKVISQVKPGDYVFIQFGHNDQKADSARHTEPASTFKANLKRFISETREKKGIPVLFTSIIRRHFDETGKLIDTHGAYIDATKEVAKETATTLIDLNNLTHNWIESLGDETSRNFFMWEKKDNTHLNIKGAKAIALMTVNELAKAIPDLSASVRYPDFIVAKDGSGDFFTIQEAINAVPDYRKEGRTRILIRKGLYYEKLIMAESKINVSLIGEEGTIISYDDFASKQNIFGENKSTSGSSTIYLYGNNLYVENITFQNTAGRTSRSRFCERRPDGV